MTIYLLIFGNISYKMIIVENIIISLKLAYYLILCQKPNIVFFCVFWYNYSIDICIFSIIFNFMFEIIVKAIIALINIKYLILKRS